jgi:hypothetical protein
MVSRVIGVIFAHRDAAAGLPSFGLEHDLRGAALGSAIGERDHAGHRQPMPVLHGGVAHIAELRLSPSFARLDREISTRDRKTALPHFCASYAGLYDSA